MSPRILLITPARAGDNNGNYHTAQRWAQMLSPAYEVTVSQTFEGQECDAMIALHAVRSAGAIRAFRARNPRAPIVLTLTGTDLYRDFFMRNAEGLQSMQFASVWVTLQEDAPRVLAQLNLPLLPPGEGRDLHVVYQSAPTMPTADKPSLVLNVAFVGHLRTEKDPQTLFDAVRLLPRELPIAINVAGNAIDAELGAKASQLMADEPRFAWLGGQSHERARELIRQAHVLVVPSVMEGGANVIAEALTSGTPVLASGVSGNVGMLGRDWPGYFPVGNARSLADALTLLVRERSALDILNAAAQRRAAVFSPLAESKSLHEAVARALELGPLGPNVPTQS